MHISDIKCILLNTLYLGLLDIYQALGSFGAEHSEPTQAATCQPLSTAHHMGVTEEGKRMFYVLATQEQTDIITQNHLRYTVIAQQPKMSLAGFLVTPNAIAPRYHISLWQGFGTR